ncbi:TAP-like protein-domain-containing protein [Alternaria rosae]|uniref:TAP-like protein-domain-containing protein n=1 Tax=Alternaria rosae TaxID=1187941 RepID=UPI001E8E4DF3|nr:TAP-like protein-domain-containing protein [Alternaria rosae]KAH6858835.1 TAP-like protein-domain-containing protein [Alternaria rosae]
MFPKTTFYLALNACLNLAATASQASSEYIKYPENSEKVAINWTDASSVLGRPDTYLGKLAVPLDYTLPQSKNNTLTLNILKVKATKEPKLGSVLTNWGGPGLPATDWLLAQARYVLAMTGGQYDIIGPDPRGTGTTLPVDCYKDEMERMVATLRTPTRTNSSEVALGAVWSYTKQYAARCFQNEAVNGSLMSTAFVARDFMKVVDALTVEGEDGFLRYWGISYGTYLGQVLAAMFPNRVERMMLDGVLNSLEYQQGWETGPAASAPVALRQFTKQCIDAGASCSLFRPNLTADALYDHIHSLSEEARRVPIVMGPNVTTDIVTYEKIAEASDTALRMGLASGSYLAGYLNSIMIRDTPEYNHTQYLVNRSFIVQDAAINADNTQLIRCSDAMFRADELTDIEERVQYITELSDWNSDYIIGSYIMCSLWKVQAKERYEGDFKAKTRKPVLLIGSPYDVRTPISGAYAANKTLEESVVLQHNGLGHTVMYSPGACAITATAAYFVNGTMPEEGTVCEQDFGIFSGKGLNETLDLFGEP